MTKHILFLLFLVVFSTGCAAFTQHEPGLDARLERGAGDQAKENSTAPAKGKVAEEKKESK